MQARSVLGLDDHFRVSSAFKGIYRALQHAQSPDMSQVSGYDPIGGLVGFRNTYRFPFLSRIEVSIVSPDWIIGA